MQIREPAVANQFYPGDPARLKQDILRYISSAELDEAVMEKLAGKEVKAVIVPHAGYIYSGPVAGFGYKLLKMLSKNVEWKVLLLGVSHSIPFTGAAPFPDGIWKTPLGEVRVKDIREELSAEDWDPGASGVGSASEPGGDDEIFWDVPEAHTEEHSLEVQVPFLQMCLEKFVLYPVATGSVRPDFLAERLVKFIEREDVIVVLSSDLSHHLSYEEAIETDRETLEGIVGMNIEKVVERGDACGIKGILTGMFLAEKLGWKPVLLDYRNSGDTAGDRSRVVGYGSVAFVTGK